ncbi:hypothetical protein [Symbiobacterium terraclitae]|uniref:hypothetical protein n=1 Tax=Symbiobacterium terraclitae TaxID=557451 RepID=UPI0035B529B0
MKVRIERQGNTVVLCAPYHPDLPARARQLGGKFDGFTKSWTFDGRDEARVRALAREIYGTDGETSETVTVRVNLDQLRDVQSLWLFGREIARRPERDREVRLGEGVVVLAGGFPASGGSVKNPRLAAETGTILEVRGVPANHSDLTTYADRIEIVAEDAPAEEAPNPLAEYSTEALIAELRRRGITV